MRVELSCIAEPGDRAGFTATILAQPLLAEGLCDDATGEPMRA
jgi:hypothetical protein